MITIFKLLCYFLSILCSVHLYPGLVVIDDINVVLMSTVLEGFRAKLGDIPYQIGFKKPADWGTGYYTFCGGTIIQPSKVVSAAHCFVKDSSFAKYFIYERKYPVIALHDIYAVAANLNSFDKYSHEEGDWRSIANVTVHPNFDFHTNDICVVTTASPFHFNDRVQNIAYAVIPTDYVGIALTSGFGKATYNMGKVKRSELLQFTRVPLMTKKECDFIHVKDMDNFICTSRRVTNIGQGDSGGPLVARNTPDGNNTVLIGIVCGHRPGYSSLFVRVTSYRKFIMNSDNNSYKFMCNIHIFICVISVHLIL